LDYLVDGGEAEDVLMRFAFAISRSSAAVSDPLPVAAAVAVSDDVPAGPRPSVTRPSVVVADDDRIVLALVRSTLQNYGMTCRSADNGIEALSLIRSERPHVAVLDVNMPGMDGFAVLAAVRARRRSRGDGHLALKVRQDVPFSQSRPSEKADSRSCWE